MLIRISLIIAILAGLAVGVVNFVQVKQVITTTRDTLATTSNELVTTTANLKQTTKDLDGTKAKLASTEETLKTTEEARDTALAEAETNRKRSTDLTEKLNKTTRERDEAQGDLAAWRALGIPVEQIKVVIANLKAAQQEIEVAKEENRLLSIKAIGLQSKLDYLIGKVEGVRLPEALRATITAVDPKWDFVVLNVGANQGVLENGELLVNRSGKLVAKVRVSVVQSDRCIANMIPGWRMGEVVEGDFAIPAFY